MAKEKSVQGNGQVETVTLNSATVERNAAYKALLDWLTSQEGVPETVVAAAKVVRPSYFGIASTGTAGDGLTPAYRKLLELTGGALPTTGTTWTEMELFERFRFGRTEAKNWCNDLTKYTAMDTTAYPRIWIKYNVTERTYTVVAVSNAVPAGWGGYLPKALSADGKAVQASVKK